MTLKSMTGFGESTDSLTLSSGKYLSIRVQCKSLNQRFVDVSTRLPLAYSKYELELHKLVKAQVTRGKVDIQITREYKSDSQLTKLNMELINSLIADVKSIQVADVKSEEFVSSFINSIWSRKDIYSDKEQELELSQEEVDLLFKVFSESLNSLINSRLVEGASLKAELVKQIELLGEITKTITAHTNTQQDNVRKSLTERLQDLNKDITISEDRLAQEICIIVDKIDITEELVRLSAHLNLFTSTLENNAEVGKKLEFITQEIGREINTIGSKSSIIEISHLVVEAKAVLERIREQIQNIE